MKITNLQKALQMLTLKTSKTITNPQNKKLRVENNSEFFCITNPQNFTKMKPLKTLLLLITILFNHYAFSQFKNAHFTLKPTLTPAGDKIIFSYDTDLWIVNTNGGNAQRITAMDGIETNPSVSPNGKWLAFSSNQYGNFDVYLMPLSGGEIKQLTFNDASDMVSSWSWDSKTIYFTSDRLNRITTYTVNINESTPKRLFNHYFNTIHNVAENPINKEIYFNESWESGRFANRKRYKGDYNPDIKSYNPTTKEFKIHTKYKGKDFAPTFDKNGNLYFKSDENNGEYNLYTLKNGIKTPLTQFSTSIMWPKVSANGNKIVFRKDYQIFVYDVNTQKTTKPKINIYTNNTLQQKQEYKTQNNITYFDVSEDNKKIAFVSRGKLFVSNTKGKFVKEIKTNAKEAVKEVKWLKDNQTLLYSQSYNGYYNWFTINALNGKNKKQITKNKMNNRQISLNKNKTKAVYLSGRNNVCLLNLNTLKTEVIVQDELWGFYNANPYFSPDNNYIVYNAYRDFETDVFVYHIPTKKVTNLTQTKVSESNPVWSPNGKHIYFESDRLNPQYPFGASKVKIYQMALDKFEKPFKKDKYNQMFEEKKGEDKEKSKPEEKVTVSINTQKIMDRLTRISPSFGSQNNASVIQQKNKTYILYLSNHKEGKSHLYKTTIEDFKDNKTEIVSKNTVYSYQLASAKNNNYILVKGNINTLDVASNKLEPLKINHTFNKSLSNEFEQMYYEAWAGVEENFYSEDFNGQNWQKLRDSYAKFIPYITNRNQLKLIFNDMLGELNTSHLGFRSNGKEEKTYYKTRSLATGILFNNEKPYIVEELITNSPVDVKGKNIKKGDILIAVNNKPVNPKKNREKYFTSPTLKKEITLTLKRNKQTFNVNIHPISTNKIKDLLYNQWQDQNQDYVHKKSNHKIAYVHMKNMTHPEFVKFKQKMVGKEAYKNGVILDLRYNTGGNMHDKVLEFLSNRTYLKWKYREGKKTSQSNFSFSNKPIVLLINEQSLSDAEMTAAGFKELKLGTIIGTETYRWIIFTSGKTLVDGSYYRLPAWGCYTLNGDDLERTGVSPDIYIGKNFKDRLTNKHPQLDKAIKVILKEMKKNK